MVGIEAPVVIHTPARYPLGGGLLAKKELLMTTKQQLAARLVEKYFSATEIHETGGFVPFIAATDGLTGQQAATVPAEGINSVWAVVIT